MARPPVLIRLKNTIVPVLLVACFLWSTANPSMATDISPGDVLVVARDSGEIHHYAASGAYLGVFVSALSTPGAIAVDASGNIYVTESTGGRVDKFSRSGDLLLTIDLPYQPGGDVAIGSDGAIYVADYFAGNVYRYSSSGAALGLFAATGLTRADFMAFDSSGHLYVGDFGSGSVRRFSPTGADLGNFVTGLAGLTGITFDNGGNLYAALSGYGVPSQSANHVVKISPTGEVLGVFGSFPFAPFRNQGGPDPIRWTGSLQVTCDESSLLSRLTIVDESH